MSKLYEAMGDIKLTTENIQKVIKMFPRDNDWKKLITKNRRDIDLLRRGKGITRKVEDELLQWALDNGEIKTDDVEELEDFIDRIMNEGTVRRVVSEDRNKDLKDLETLSLAYVDQLRKDKDVKVLTKQISVLKKKLGVKEEVEESESVDLDEGKMKRNPLIDNNPDVKAARKAHANGTWDGNVDKEGEAIVHIKGKPYTVTNKFESVELDEGKMKEFHAMVKKGMTAEQISKKIGIDVKAIKDFMKDMD